MNENNLPARRPLDYYVLWVIAVMSLAINLYLIYALVQARRQVAQAASTAAAAVDQLRTAAIDTSVPIQQSLPVSFTVTYRQTVSVPISVTLPINTNVTVPLNTPLGNFPINIPVNTTIPVNINPQIPLDLAVPVSVSVPISLSVPIHLAVSDTSFAGTLSNASDYLNGVAASLGAPTPTPTP